MSEIIEKTIFLVIIVGIGLFLISCAHQDMPQDEVDYIVRELNV